MVIEESVLFPFVAAIAITLVGIVVKRLNERMGEIETRMREQADKLEKITVELPTNYASKSEMGRLIDAVFTKIDAMDAKMDSRTGRISQILERLVEK